MITEEDARAGAARDMGILIELDFQTRDNHRLTSEVGRLKDENAKLRKELEQWHKLTAGIELPEYPITQFQPKDLERENAKLRELVRWMYDRMDESCAVQHPYAPAPINYDQLMQAATRAHKLGVEVE